MQIIPESVEIDLEIVYIHPVFNRSGIGQLDIRFVFGEIVCTLREVDKLDSAVVVRPVDVYVGIGEIEGDLRDFFRIYPVLGRIIVSRFGASRLGKDGGTVVRGHVGCREAQKDSDAGEQDGYYKKYY